MVVPPLNPALNAVSAPVIGNIPRAGQLDLATRYLGHRSVRDIWIALWVLWLLWALLFLAKQILDATRMMDARRPTRATAPTRGQDGGVATGLARGSYDSTLQAPVLDGAGGIVSENSNTAPPATLTHPTARPGRGLIGRTMEDISERIDMTYGVVRDLTLMLLLVVALNTFGLGSEVAMLILVWVYVFIALFWAGLMMLLEIHIVGLVLGSIEMLLLLAMLIAAYSIGWTVID